MADKASTESYSVSEKERCVDGDRTGGASISTHAGEPMRCRCEHLLCQQQYKTIRLKALSTDALSVADIETHLDESRELY